MLYIPMEMEIKTTVKNQSELLRTNCRDINPENPVVSKTLYKCISLENLL